jgi:hypothetical protein
LISNDDAETRWFTYAELGQARGISTASATRLAFRRKWRRQVANDGTARVSVPADEAKPVMTRVTSRHDDMDDVTRALDALTDQVTELRAGLRSDHERQRADWQAQLKAALAHGNWFEAECRKLFIRVGHAEGRLAEIEAMKAAPDLQPAKVGQSSPDRLAAWVQKVRAAFRP